MKVLFLPAWYPHRRDAMCGLFVRKHAQAASRHADVHVLYIQSEPGLERTCYEELRSGQVTEHYVYYPAANRGGKFLRLWRYGRAYAAGLQRVFGQWRPDVVHVQVLTRNAVAAYWLKLRYGIPYAVTEHWTRYMLGHFTGWWHRRLTAFVVKHSAAVMPVSEALGADMRRCGLHHPNYLVVRNVVDDFFFAEAPRPMPAGEGAAGGTPRKRFVHVCCFAEAQKNNFGLLRVLKRLGERRSDFVCYMVGGGRDWAATRAYADSLGLRDEVVFTGEVTPLEVHTQLAGAAFSVFFSRYETASVVVAESLSAGKPVVCTSIPAIAEIMDDHTGRMVPVEDEAALLETLEWMLDHADAFDGAAMQRKARRLFSAETVGKQFDEIYRGMAAVRRP
ncbi:MAG: glycosyltransferase [Bacteroidales bacterium]|nr:glycosyltransferase [Bacteroidales bacterium]